MLQPGGPVVEDLAALGYSVQRDVVPAELISELRAATDQALVEEAPYFPAGDAQHGRLLFAPSHGGAFLRVLADEPLFQPIEAVLGEEAILYTMTTSVLGPRSVGPVSSFHVDLPTTHPDGLGMAVLVMLDDFRADNGATEVVPRSHRATAAERRDEEPVLVTGSAGDVCYFDPRLSHRSTENRTDRPRRALLVGMVQPWMKQRFDIRSMVDRRQVDRLPEVVARRLGLRAVPPASREEFIARRDARPWS